MQQSMAGTNDGMTTGSAAQNTQIAHRLQVNELATLRSVLRDHPLDPSPWEFRWG